MADVLLNTNSVKLLYDEKRVPQFSLCDTNYKDGNQRCPLLRQFMVVILFICISIHLPSIFHKCLTVDVLPKCDNEHMCFHLFYGHWEWCDHLVTTQPESSSAFHLSRRRHTLAESVSPPSYPLWQSEYLLRVPVFSKHLGAHLNTVPCNIMVAFQRPVGMLPV